MSLKRVLLTLRPNLREEEEAGTARNKRRKRRLDRDQEEEQKRKKWNRAKKGITQVSTTRLIAIIF